MSDISPQIQYDVLKLFSNNFSEELPSTLIEQMFENGPNLININGYFPIHHMDESSDDSSPAFLPIEGKDIGLDHDVYILQFNQHSIPQGQIDSDDLKWIEANLLALNESLIEQIHDIPHEQLYYNIKFDLADLENDDENDVLISFNRLQIYAHLLISGVDLVSPDIAFLLRWNEVPLTSIRSQLYHYALQHDDIAKIWICIISTSVRAYCEFHTQNSKLKHIESLKGIFSPHILDPLICIVEPISEARELFGREDFDQFSKSTILYDDSKSQFWLWNWFRIHKKTKIVTIQTT